MAAVELQPTPVVGLAPSKVEKIDVDVKAEEKGQEEALEFDPVLLKERYLAERDRRLARNEGVEQYTIVDGNLTHYLTDPWVGPGFTRDPIQEEVDVVIIGGGYGAQVMAVRLIEVGISNFRIIEKAGDFGGTW